MKITEQDIRVTEEDRWKAGKETIINDEVLKYFKANLGRDERGYFIENRWGDLTEKGYLREVRGFPLLAVELSCEGSLCQATLDGGQSAELLPGDFFFCDDVTVGFIYKGIPVRLAVRAMAGLALHLTEDPVGFMIMDQRLKQIPREELFPLPVI
jgi:hypothetical protein